MSGPPGNGGDPRLFPALAGLVLSGQTMSGLLDLIVNLAVSVLDGVDQASVSAVHRDGERLETSNSTSADIRDIDEAQYAEAKGPCVQAIRTASEVVIELPVGKWPVFSERAIQGGIRSVTSLPLTAAGHTGGALNLYSTTVTALTADTLTTARALAAQGAVVLANASALAVAEMTNQQLQEALETRDLIGQAKGILMARQRVNSDTAFDMLRRASQRTNRKLRDVAAGITEHFGDPEADL
jgi:transcriptional regulator with GAF, ATPase, and Fis domain